MGATTEMVSMVELAVAVERKVESVESVER